MIVVAFLFPVAVYCLIVGQINRRRHPLMVSAAWDFAGLIWAASGFIAFGIPGFLNGFSERGRQLALFGRPAGSDGGLLAFFADLFEGLCAALFTVGNSNVLTAYFVLVVAACALLLWRRQRQTAIYNVRPEVFDEVLAGVLDAGRVAWSRAGNRYFIRPAVAEPLPRAKTPEQAIQPGPAREHLPAAPARHSFPSSAEDLERSAYLEVDAAPALCHVTLSWETDNAGLRRQVEGELAQALGEVGTHGNPAALWLLTAGSVLTCFTLMTFVYAVLVRLLGR